MVETRIVRGNYSFQDIGIGVNALNGWGNCII